jgi:hypothetical protein
MENQEQQPIQPETPVQPAPRPVEPKKSLPKWPLIIVGVILLVTLLTGTYLLGKNQTVNQKPTLKTTQVITPTITPIPTQGMVATTSPASVNGNQTWKTYQAKGYSIRYPSTWIVEHKIIGGNSDAIRIFNPSSMIDEYGNGGADGTQVPTEELLIQTVLTDKTAKQYVDSLAPATDSPLYQTFTKGRKTMSFTALSAEIYPDIGEGSSGDNIVFGNTGVITSIHVTGNYTTGIINQILASFKFVN